MPSKGRNVLGNIHYLTIEALELELKFGGPYRQLKDLHI